ncbi:MAG TPA: flagellar basal body-associated FliL family protein [Geminicoccaceae bacterium]|nr:flagellar basal body-associated FliL family protein [Geminicoccus sp.]HMU48199.1 flagellar basal body-associated FliL family protein [Geminicoccaceae bacterium]
MTAAVGAVEAGKGGGKGKLMLIAGGLVVLLGGGAGVAWMLGLFGGGHGAAATTAEAPHGEGHEPAHGEKAAAGSGVAFVDLPDVIVNLQPTGSRMRFLKLKVSLEVKGESEAEAIRALTPRIMDSFQLYLRALAVEEVQGAAGMQRLKEEMLARVHRAVEPQRIEDVLFKEMLVQ